MTVDAKHRRHFEHQARSRTILPGRTRPRRGVLAAVAAGAVATTAVILPLTGSSSAQAGEELVKNGGFEAGVRGWTPSDSIRKVAVVKTAHSGASALTMTSLVTGSYSLRDHPNTVRQTPAGATYRFSAWVKGSQPGTQVSLRVREVRQQYIPGTRVRQLVRKQTADTVLQGAGWRQLTMVYRADPGNQLDLGVFVWNGRPGQSVTVDDVSLVRLAADPGAPPAASPTRSDPAKDNQASPSPATSTPPSSAPSPDPSASSHVPTKPIATGTGFGFSTWPDSGESYLQAVARRDRDFGKAGVVRVFYPGLPAAWPGNAGSVGRDVVVSFKGSPSAIASGAEDGRLRTWFQTAPRDRNVYWSFYHEPEDNIAKGEFTAADYRAAWKHLAQLAHEANNPNLKATLILMSWTVNKSSGRTWTDYYAGSNVIDVLGWDAYNDGAKPSIAAAQRRYDDPGKIFGAAVQVSRAAGKPFGFAEWASLLVPGDSGSGRAAWIRNAASYQASAKAVFSTYFDCPIGVGDYRITDTSSTQAMRDVMR